MRRPRHAGFSLVELVMALAVAMILLVVGVPAFRDVVRRHQVIAASNALLADIAYARSEAIFRGGLVSICPSSDPTHQACARGGKAFDGGWIVYAPPSGAGKASAAYAQDADARLRVGNARAGVAIQAADDVILSFGPQGQVQRADHRRPTFAICFRPSGAPGISTAAVPGVQLTVNTSGSASSKKLAPSAPCSPS